MDAMLSADNIATVTDPSTGVFSVKIKDMTKGQSAIEKFLIDLKNRLRQYLPLNNSSYYLYMNN